MTASHIHTMTRLLCYDAGRSQRAMCSRITDDLLETDDMFYSVVM